MDWENVGVFLAVARAGQCVGAAERLRLDRATVSRRIAALEAAFGAGPFDRRATGARLTSAGERFFSAAEEMESAFLHAQAEISNVELASDVLDTPEEARFAAQKLTDYGLGVYASAARRKVREAPREVSEIARRGRIGRLEEYAFSGAPCYIRELYGGAPTAFERASAVTPLEALRAGLGVVHDFIARRLKDRRRVPPERRAGRGDRRVPRQDARGLGRIRAVCERLKASVRRGRPMFV